MWGWSRETRFLKWTYKGVNFDNFVGFPKRIHFYLALETSVVLVEAQNQIYSSFRTVKKRFYLRTQLLRWCMKICNSLPTFVTKPSWEQMIIKNAMRSNSLQTQPRFLSFTIVYQNFWYRIERKIVTSIKVAINYFPNKLAVNEGLKNWYVRK